MIAKSIKRVSSNTDEAVNSQIRRHSEMHIAYFEKHPDQIDQRLRELDEEWDIERMLETGSSGLTLFGLAMSLIRGRKWLLLPLAVQGFFLQHALQGWCPPLSALRRMGFRTQYEIEQERYALKEIRGDQRKASRATAQQNAKA